MILESDKKDISLGGPIVKHSLWQIYDLALGKDENLGDSHDEPASNTALYSVKGCFKIFWSVLRA